MTTKQRLTRYGKLKREIRLLEERIRAAGGGEVPVTDYAKDYRTGRPKIITLRGHGAPGVPRLSERLATCVAECAAVERFVGGIEDGLLRQLLELHFLGGMSWEDAARQAGYSARQAIRLSEAFFERCHSMSLDVMNSVW